MSITLEHCLLFMMDTFKKYAEKEGDKCTLNKNECLALIQNELPHICGKEVSKASCQRLLDEMNTNKDDCVDYPEYIVFLARVSMEFNAYFCDTKGQHKK
ncbi:protein S100-A4-like [Ambystoma mexicanum]|uniref:protein S100-A4-like n=1 Tax=Ambystoma mexicanum TaxID=8296 RepID=UPI0037E9B3AE